MPASRNVSFALTQPPDSASLNVGLGSAPITASFSLTGPADTAALAVANPVDASFSLTGPVDSLAAQADVVDGLSFALTSPSDILAANLSAQSGLSASFSLTSPADTLAAQADALASASFALTSPADSLAAGLSTLSSLSASFSIIQPPDAAQFSIDPGGGMPNDPAYTPINSCIDTDQATTVLKAATATGAGATFSNATKRLGGDYANFTWQVVVTGGPTAISTTLQGSDNGTNWQTLDTSTLTTGEARAVANTPAAFLRANLGTLTGGTSPTVTVLIQPG